MAQLPYEVTTSDHAREVLQMIVELTESDAPALARVARATLESDAIDTCISSIALLYRLGLEQGQPYVADLADELLGWLERTPAIAS